MFDDEELGYIAFVLFNVKRNADMNNVEIPDDHQEMIMSIVEKIKSRLLPADESPVSDDELDEQFMSIVENSLDDVLQLTPAIIKEETEK